MTDRPPLPPFDLESALAKVQAAEEVLEFTWGADRLRIELQADGAGTLLTLTDTFDDLGKAARDGAGWHECLDRLASDLDGTLPPPWGERWRRVHPRYVTHLGPDASSIGPPPGWDGAAG